MLHFKRIALLALLAMFALPASAAFAAQDSATGAGIGIGRIGGQAADATARQPEAGGRIFTNMIIAAALVEGVALFTIVVCFLTFFMLTQ